jgi:hypothetical protein
MQQNIPSIDWTEFDKRFYQIDFDARARITVGRQLRGDDSRHPRLQPTANREFGRNAFSYRVCKSWNDLPSLLKDSDMMKFPTLCKNHYLQ